MTPACSVVIPSYQSTPTIANCLTALLNQDIIQPFEIIVVDSSSDETPTLVRHNFPQIRLIHRSRQTDPALARNLGAQQAQGETLAFVDADCIAHPDWLRRLYTTLQEGYDGVGGSIVNGNGDSLISWAGYMCEFREFLPIGQPRDVLNLTLGNAAYRRDVFWAAGGFPTDCFPQEDQVFHHGLSQRGARLRFDPQIVVAHFHRTNPKAFLQHQRRIGRANARVLGQLNLPGAGLARRPWLARLAMPALVMFRFARTIFACRNLANGLIFQRPTLVWWCWLGMCWWGQGFIEAAQIPRSEDRVYKEG
jgi:glycosyltransferase involved in cell wall biosynthesis